LYQALWYDRNNHGDGVGERGTPVIRSPMALKIKRNKNHIMTDTEKLILDKLESMSVDLREVKDKTARIEDRVTGIEDRVTRMELTIGNDISKKIDMTGEGRDFLKQRLDEALQFEKKREGMEWERINHRMEINKIKDRLDIA